MSEHGSEVHPESGERDLTLDAMMAAARRLNRKYEGNVSASLDGFMVWTEPVVRDGVLQWVGPRHHIPVRRRSPAGDWNHVQTVAAAAACIGRLLPLRSK